MNRVSECKDAKQQVALGSLWKAAATEYYKTSHLIATDKGLVNLRDGTIHYSKNKYVLEHPGLYTQVYCVTIERDKDE